MTKREENKLKLEYRKLLPEWERAILGEYLTDEDHYTVGRMAELIYIMEMLKIEYDK